MFMGLATWIPIELFWILHVIYITFLNLFLRFFPLQMVCSCCFLYALRSWRILSFTAGDSAIIADYSTKFVPLKTLKHTLPMSGAYLLYMVWPFKVSSHFLFFRKNSQLSLIFSFYYVIHSCISPWKLVTMESVRGVNVPMYTTLRRTTVVFTMIVEFLLVRQRYTPPVIFR